MIDIHSHILPGLDDGPSSIEESIALAQAAFDAGTRILVATPHILDGLDLNRDIQIVTVFTHFQKELGLLLPEMKVLLGSEIYFRPNLSDLLDYEVATMGGEGCYMLVEFSLTDIPRNFERELRSLRQSGIVPVIAHPERNATVLRYPALVKQMVDTGALIQINAGSLTGLFGRKVKNMARYLLKRGWVKVIASDAHGANRRGPDLRMAVSEASEVVGVANARRLVEENPARIIEAVASPDKKTLDLITGG